MRRAHTHAKVSPHGQWTPFNGSDLDKEKKMFRWISKHTMTKKGITVHFKIQLGIEDKTAFRSGD